MKWTFNEEQTLKIHYSNYTNKELAVMLNRTEGAVKTKAKDLGLRKGTVYVAPEREDVKPKQPKPKFKSYYEPISIEAIRQTYGVNV